MSYSDISDIYAPSPPVVAGVTLTEQKQLDLQQNADAFVKLVDRWGDVTLGAITAVDKADNEQATTTKTHADLKFASAGIVLNVYSTYFLPLLYGLMGACCYMLREIIRENGRRRFAAMRKCPTG